MTEKLEVGQIVQGKVTGVQPYGAFVALNDEVQGLVHISEVTHGYVKDIKEHLAVGDEVTVKILSIDEEKNKVSLSIRATEEKPKTRTKPQAKAQHVQEDSSSAGFNTLRDKLQDWINQTENK
ncbi:S1 domain-containing post-transcriptional regulator GSP13 [Virgibacillus soli]|uniref:S1 domain-containing post-transcriptional regulator GSP13 n=1 Tax=Paracerasibacillus soli TaxID=480284 RepID=A0ABU5CQY1_9BACI|nr:S1 domain-containing post-transcriptional regulator GSP13 [Virgibacillus soli]MDY0408767.1 S1 domain-containing post-transcriptional regulator GSP13 [Virgibacillus soli]